MKDDKIITINLQDIQKIISELYIIQSICDDKLIKDKVEKVLSLINSSTNIGLEVSIADVIFDKMKEIRYIDEDAYFKLYMIYRKLEDGKISESEAKAIFKICERQKNE
jgi:hypothetical protein